MCCGFIFAMQPENFEKQGYPLPKAVRAWPPRDNGKYDAIGQLNTSTRYLNLDDAGVGVASGQQVTTFSYDRAGRLLSTIQHSPQGTDPLITSGTVTTVYTYDGLGRVLTTAPAELGASRPFNDPLAVTTTVSPTPTPLGLLGSAAVGS